MRVLIIKLSSMGDVLHALPALTECLSHFPQIKFDWVVEPGFKDILTWHPGIKNIITFPLRSARKNPKLFFTEMPKIIKKLRSHDYDLVIDAQGLIKSALLSRLIKTKKNVGLDKESCREPLASKFYHQSYSIPWSSHAVMRVKQLFSKIFGYTVSSEINYGLDPHKLISSTVCLEKKQNDFFVFLHGTTWQTKHWPETYWLALIKLVNVKYPDIIIYLPWGSEIELNRANRLAKASQQVQVLPKLSIAELAYYIVKAKTVVAVDTGLGHLAAALGTKTINLYGSTDPTRTGTLGLNQIHLAVHQMNANSFSCAPCLKRTCQHPKYISQNYPPCYQVINPELVMKNLAL